MPPRPPAAASATSAAGAVPAGTRDAARAASAGARRCRQCRAARPVLPPCRAHRAAVPPAAARHHTGAPPRRVRRCPCVPPPPRPPVPVVPPCRVRRCPSPPVAARPPLPVVPPVPRPPVPVRAAMPPTAVAAAGSSRRRLPAVPGPPLPAVPGPPLPAVPGPPLPAVARTAVAGRSRTAVAGAARRASAATADVPAVLPASGSLVVLSPQPGVATVNAKAALPASVSHRLEFLSGVSWSVPRSWLRYQWGTPLLVIKNNQCPDEPRTLRAQTRRADRFRGPLQRPKIIGSIAFQAVPIRIANVHRHANDCIVVSSGPWCRQTPLQTRCQLDDSAAASHVRHLRDGKIHSVPDR